MEAQIQDIIQNYYKWLLSKGIYKLTSRGEAVGENKWTLFSKRDIFISQTES